MVGIGNDSGGMMGAGWLMMGSLLDWLASSQFEFLLP